jgi:hypothetical protein
MGPWYATREDVLSAIDMQESARSAAQVDRALDSGARSIEGLLRRKFYPWTGTRYFPWPAYQYARPWRLWLDQDEVISVSAFTAGGVTVDTADLFLEPVNSGPPYTRIEVDLSSSAAFSTGPTPQRALAVTGVFGYSADTEPAGALAEALDGTETAVDVTDSSAIGVGSILLVDDERMTVTAKSMLDTGQTLQADLTASAADVSVSVTTGSSYAVGETVLLDSERMSIVDIAGNTLTVKRATDGTVLATHSGSTIYAPRTLTVVRGDLGTTAATHSDATAITRHVVPGLVRELNIAEALNGLQQEQSGYARVVGEGDNAIEVRGQGLTGLRLDALDRYGRRARTRAI